MQATGAKREETGSPPHLLHCHSSAQYSDLLLFQLGKELGCNKIVTGDTATVMAVRVIAETSKVRLTRGVHVGSGHVGMRACVVWRYVSSRRHPSRVSRECMWARAAYTQRGIISLFRSCLPRHPPHARQPPPDAVPDDVATRDAVLS